MDFSIIVCTNNKNGIGYYDKINNKYTIPWHNSDDLKYFKKITTEYDETAIIMGKNTFLSLPNGPLPKRLNIVLTSDENLQFNNKITSFTNLNDALNHCKNENMKKCFVIGGAKLYKEAIENPYLDFIYWNVINNNIFCNITFPINLDFATHYYEKYTINEKNTNELTFYKFSHKQNFIL